MSKKIRMDVDKNNIYDFSRMVTNHTVFNDYTTLEKDGFRIHLEDSKTDCYINFETDTPSNQSFLIFGGLYDPKTGLVYATLNKNKEAIIAYDFVELFNKRTGKNADRKSMTEALIKYKITGDYRILDESFQKPEKGSVILRHFRSQTESTEDIANVEFFVNLAIGVSSILNNIEYNASHGLNSNIEYMNLLYSLADYPINQIDLVGKPSYDEISIYKMSSRVSMKKGVTGNSTSKHGIINDKLELLKENIEELYDTKETLVYSKDTVSTLRRNGFANNVTKENIHLLKDCDDIIYKNYYTLYGIDDMSRNIDNVGFEEIDVLAINVKELIYLNKTFRKLSK